MDGVSSGCYVIDKDYTIISMNEVAKTMYPRLAIGEKCYRCLMGLNAPCSPCPVAKGKNGPSTYIDPIRHISEVVDAVELPVPGVGLCHALVFSTVGENEKLAASLPISPDELESLALVRALTVDYCDVFSINAQTGFVTVYRLNHRPIDEGNPIRTSVPYPEALNHYIEKYVIPEDREPFAKENDLTVIRERLTRCEVYDSHFRICLNGEIHYYYRKISRVGSADSFTNFVIGVGCEDGRINSIHKRKQLAKNLAQIERDVGTGLYTREAFVLRSEALLKAHPEKHYDFCICRLENLGMINHQYGMTMGDRILSLIGRLLEQYSDEENNCIGYLGNGIFASFTPNDPPEERKAAVYAFRDNILRQSPIKEISLKWSIYVDLLFGQGIESIIEKANYALSIVRADTRKDYIEFDHSVIARMERENELEQKFEQALANGEFLAYYQPKVDAVTGAIVGAEALTRWIRPDGLCISPGEFIPVLENAGKIELLDEYIFRQVCRLKKKLRDSGIDDLPISVNLSRASLFKNDIPGVYSVIADSYCADRTRIPIEITESAAVRSISIRAFAEELTKAGFLLHMDDFGSGYSSLASLQTLPFSCIKIDKSLTDNIGLNDTEAILRHTVAFAKEIGMEVVAEGVERKEQVTFLRSIGCDQIQGFFFYRPMPEKEFLEKLAK